jgi:hypothetical protein
MLTRELLEEQYVKRRMSMAEIAALAGCSIHSVVYWMDQHRMPRRSRSAATYEKHNRIPPYHLKENLTLDDMELKALALGLFLGEGNRRSTEAVRLGNSDPLVVKLFTKFLIDICGVRIEKIRIGLVIHPDLDVQQTERFWSRELGLSPSHFQKTTVITPRGRGTYGHRIAYGVATVGVYSVDLRRLIQKWLDEFVSRRDSSVAEHAHGKGDTGVRFSVPATDFDTQSTK